MYTWLYNYFNKYNCLYKRQFGFRNANSTINTLVSTTEGIRKALHKNRFSCTGFLDFQKTFDTVNHKILLK